MDYQGLDAMQAVVARAREVFAKVSLESERILNTTAGRQILHLVRTSQPAPVKPTRPSCWLCDRRLWAGGRSFVIIRRTAKKHPAHKSCVQQAGLPVSRKTGSETLT